MDMKMPRGAIPTPRSELAAAEPYRPDPDAEVSVPSGEFPTPNQELVAARPYRTAGDSPESFLRWPGEMEPWGDGTRSGSTWAEEAFAKACAEPKVTVPAAEVLEAAQACGSSSFAQFMQTQGFRVGGKRYLDGPFYTVNWTDAAVLNGAIAKVGPVKIGVPSTMLTSSSHGQITAGKSGWAMYGLQKSQPGDHCASLCGYGSLAALAGLFERYGVSVKTPPGMPAGLCYAMFTSGSVGIVDRESLMNVIGEAWVRIPTTVVKDLRG